MLSKICNPVLVDPFAAARATCGSEHNEQHCRKQGTNTKCLWQTRAGAGIMVCTRCSVKKEHIANMSTQTRRIACSTPCCLHAGSHAWIGAPWSGAVWFAVWFAVRSNTSFTPTANFGLARGHRKPSATSTAVSGVGRRRRGKQHRGCRRKKQPLRCGAR